MSKKIINLNTCFLDEENPDFINEVLENLVYFFSDRLDRKTIIDKVKNTQFISGNKRAELELLDDRYVQTIEFPLNKYPGSFSIILEETSKRKYDIRTMVCAVNEAEIGVGPFTKDIEKLKKLRVIEQFLKMLTTDTEIKQVSVSSKEIVLELDSAFSTHVFAATKDNSDLITSVKEKNRWITEATCNVLRMYLYDLIYKDEKIDFKETLNNEILYNVNYTNSIMLKLLSYGCTQKKDLEMLLTLLLKRDSDSLFDAIEKTLNIDRHTLVYNFYSNAKFQVDIANGNEIKAEQYLYNNLAKQVQTVVSAVMKNSPKVETCNDLKDILNVPLFNSYKICMWGDM